jgi:hypothetical protein
MSQGNYNAPPPKSGGMSTLTIVLIIFGVLGLICVGACGACYYGVMFAGKAFIATAVAEATMINARQNQEIKDELGDPMTVESPKFEQKGETVIVTFDVKGSKATGKGYVEVTGADPNNPGNAKPSVATITLPSGKKVDVANPPATSPGDMPEMPDDADGVTIPETPGADTPDDSSNM